MPATDQQVQRYVNERIRPHAELLRRLVTAYEDDLSAIDPDIYAALTQGTPTWSDDRADGPPHLLTPADVLAINTFMSDIRTAMKAHPQYAVVLRACVQAV